ncbi:MAG TPA: type I-MYXAN CRISPR-associated protein Cas6/Cmx6 [Candidatus Hydrogenedentes bacterium]|nr:type I-MYXAN CRISPR-associated protein Cas6/Cmx6 [Candidatus Hydrogenedentota bacterium]HPK25725.1 type I-MYXAN CRISPR-associated protein Cas6/Cmx6 [Candidatus Hydrogenedentota bacterium]
MKNNFRLNNPKFRIIERKCAIVIFNIQYNSATVYRSKPILTFNEEVNVMHVVDMEFPVTGNRIAADHGYALYGSLSRLLPNVHPQGNKKSSSDKDSLAQILGIHPINGRLCGDRSLELTAQSRIRFRLPAEYIQDFLLLTGKILNLDSDRLTLGAPTIRQLTPAPRLYSRLVTIKGYQTENSFLEAVQGQLADLNIHGIASLVPRSGEVSLEGKNIRTEGEELYIRRTLRIADREIVGFAVRVQDLTAQESLDLQIRGLGGRRKMGCGIFIPERN